MDLLLAEEANQTRHSPEKEKEYFLCVLQADGALLTVG